MNKALSKLAIASLALFSTSINVSAETSSLWGSAGEKWSPTSRLQDFSWAGYHSSAKEIPNVPVIADLSNTAAKPNDTIDDAGYLQNLIDNANVSAANPGAIFVPKGRWYIKKRVNFNKSGLVLRGEEGTEFYTPISLSEIDGVDPATTQKYSNAGGFFIASKGINKTKITTINKAAAKGDNSFSVASSANLKVGDFILVTQTDQGDKSLAKFIHGDLNEMGPASYEEGVYPLIFTWYAKITSVEANVFKTDRTVPLDVLTKWKPEVYVIDLSKSLTEVGMENFTLRASGVKKLAHLHEAGFNGIEYTGVINGWIKNVKLIDTDNGFAFNNNTIFTTITDVKYSGDKRTAANHTSTAGEIAHHPLWLKGNAAYNLVKNFEIADPTHHDLTNEGLAHHNVFMSGKGKRLNFDHHRNAPWANLFTDIEAGDASRIWMSTGRWDRGPHTAKDLTVWNIRKTSNSFPISAPDIDNSSTRINAGHNVLDWPFINIIGMQGTTKKAASRTDQFVELGNASTIEPANLFLAQLAKRLNTTNPPQENRAPTIKFTSPLQSELTLKEAYKLSIEVEASDLDSNLAYTVLYIDGDSIRKESVAPYNWGVEASPTENELNNLPIGSHQIRVYAVDSLGAKSFTEFTLIVEEEPITSAIQNLAQQAAGEIFIYDIRGDLIRRAKSDQLDLSSLSKGFYFAIIKTSDSQITKRFYINK